MADAPGVGALPALAGSTLRDSLHPLAAYSGLVERHLPRRRIKRGSVPLIDESVGGYDCGHEISRKSDRTPLCGGDTGRLRFNQSYRANAVERSWASASKSDLGV